jgi:hypothetical protein
MPTETPSTVTLCSRWWGTDLFLDQCICLFSLQHGSSKNNPWFCKSKHQNLSSPQKELILWPQRLSNAKLTWIQCLLHNQKWLEDFATMALLHSGPFIVSLSQAPTCNVQHGSQNGAILSGNHVKLCSKLRSQRKFH